MRSVWRKGNAHHPMVVRVCLLALELQRGCKGRQEESVLAKGIRIWRQNAPESQTLIVLVPPFLKMSPDALTICVPSGEKSTDSTGQSWAFAFSPLSSSVSAAKHEVSVLGEGSRRQKSEHLNPRL